MTDSGSSASAERTCSSITGTTTPATVATIPVVAAAAAATPNTPAVVMAAAFMAITRPTVRLW